jgi:hypothetical protein
MIKVNSLCYMTGNWRSPVLDLMLCRVPERRLGGDALRAVARALP